MKLYENQSYLMENETVVTSCTVQGDRIFLELEDTIFFPEEGGQHADTGNLWTGEQKIRLMDGQIQAGKILYRVDQPVAVGAKVKCELDWEARYMRMQQHTGEHILTGLIHHRFGYDNVGFHLSDTAPVTLDLNGTLTPEQVKEMEVLANEMIYANLPVTASYPSKEELPDLDYRSKIEIEGQVRLITIGTPEAPVDVCACCAPHVKRTGEVGMIKIVSTQNYKGGIRLGILCGKRALAYVQEQTAIVGELAKMFSTSADKVINCVQNQSKELADLKYRLAELREQQLMEQIRSLPRQRHVCFFTDADLSAVTVKNCFNAMTERFDGYAGLFIGNDESGYRYNAGSSHLDARELMQVMKEKLNARGGGSAQMIQGKAAATEAQIRELFETIQEKE